MSVWSKARGRGAPTMSVQAVPQLEFADIWLTGAGAPMAEIVLRGYGVGVLPEHMVREDLDSGRLRRLLPDVELLSDSFRLLYRSGSSHAATFAELAAVLRDRPLT